MAEGKKPAQGAHRGVGPVRVRDGTPEPHRRKVFLHGKQREYARTHPGTGQEGVSEHHRGNLFPTLQAGVQRRGQPGHHRGHQPGRPGPAVDRDDGPETGEVDLLALGRTEDPLPHGHHRGRVRLLRRNSGKGAQMVAGPQLGMALPPAEGTPADVAAIHHRQRALHLECGERKDFILTIRRKSVK